MASPTNWNLAFRGLQHSYPIEGPYILLEAVLKKLKEDGSEIPDLTAAEKAILHKIHLDLYNDKAMGLLSEKKYLHLLKENVDKLKCSE